MTSPPIITNTCFANLLLSVNKMTKLSDYFVMQNESNVSQLCSKSEVASLSTIQLINAVKDGRGEMETLEMLRSSRPEWN